MGHESQGRFIRLALSISGCCSSSVGGVPLSREPYFRQVQRGDYYVILLSVFQLLEWQKRGSYDKIPSSILRFYHILAGCVDRLVASGTPNWKGVLGLLLWYPSPDPSVYVSTAPDSSQLLDKSSTHTDFSSHRKSHGAAQQLLSLRYGSLKRGSNRNDKSDDDCHRLNKSSVGPLTSLERVSLG